MSVAPTPRIALLATGDELVDIHQRPLPHQIRASTIYAISAALRDRGFTQLHTQLVSDDPHHLIRDLAAAVSAYDICIITGAVSAGKFDLVPSTLQQLGVKEHFHHVAQRPGKPLWCGETSTGTLVFGLPGNPVAALICCYRYILPALSTMQGGSPALSVKRYAQLSEPLFSSRGKEMTLFAPVTISYDGDGITRATPLARCGSADLAALLASDGFVECPPGREEFPQGEALALYPWGLQ